MAYYAVTNAAMKSIVSSANGKKKRGSNSLSWIRQRGTQLKKLKKPNVLLRRDARIERRMGVIEREIAKLEQQVEALDAQTAEFATDYIRLGELEVEKTELAERIDSLYAEWAQLDGQ